MRTSNTLKNSLFLLFVMLPTTVVNAQHLLEEMTGTYTGKATTTTIVDAIGLEVPGADKNFSVEIQNPSEDGFTTLVMKDYSVGSYVFANIQLQKNLFFPVTGKLGHLWDIVRDDNIAGYYPTKGGKVQIALTFPGFHNTGSQLNADNETLVLNFEVKFENKTIRYKFRGKRLSATSISSVRTDQAKDDVIYDLQGRRVSKPTHGIYIVNGKKVIM